MWNRLVEHFANDEFEVNHLEFLFPFVEILASFEIDRSSLLISTLHSQLEDSIRNRQQLSCIWTAFLSQCTSFVLERFPPKEILEYISLPTGELFGLDCFDFLRAKIQQDSPLTIPFVLNAVTSDLKRPVEIAELLIQRPDFSTDSLFNTLLQNHFLSLNFAVRRAKNLSVTGWKVKLIMLNLSPFICLKLDHLFLTKKSLNLFPGLMAHSQLKIWSCFRCSRHTKRREFGLEKH